LDGVVMDGYVVCRSKGGFMQAAPNGRLDEIRVELGEILEKRVSELMNSMRESEEFTRRILATELEMARARQLREDLDGESQRVQQDLDALRARAEEVRSQHSESVQNRDLVREEVRTMERDVDEARNEVRTARIKLRDLEKEGDSLRQENVELKIKFRTLEENVGRMRKLRDELLSSITQLSQQMTTIGENE
jgi:chromosome segregation ATPase